MMSFNNHLFLLSYNSFPLLASFMSFNLFFSFIMMMKFYFNFSFFISTLSMVTLMINWWISYNKEFNLLGFNSMDLEMALKFSMILFISSEIFFFFSFFWSYFHFFLNPMLEIGGIWPPSGVLSFKFSNVPMLNTFILISSGITVTMAHYNLNFNNYNKFNLYMSSTIILGISFSFFQLMEYYSSFFSISDSSFGSSFFMLTGFHGIHVIIGTFFLSYSLFLSLFKYSSSHNFISMELSSWYWHFVDVVWLFLFFFLYYINN